MRWLFIILVVGNFGYWAWNYLYLKPATDKLPQTTLQPNGEGESLRMVGEGGEPAARVMEPATEKVVSEQPEQADTQVANAPKPAAPTKACLRIENYSRDDSEQIKGLIGRYEGTITDGGEMEGTQKKYWVMVPPYSSRREADAAVARLKAAKVKDFYRVRSGEYSNAISMGVFSTIDSAKRRVSGVEKLRAKVKRLRIEEIELPATRNWLAVRFESSASMKPITEAIDAAGYARYRQVACP